QRVLDTARRQLKGQIGLSYDNAESVALDMAKRYLHYGRTQTKEQLFERLDALTPDELWLTAQEVFAPERITTLIFK
ncbi:MAG: insulinase family protein, partial [Bacteroidaceae bacterium]|nr:insulinase family protein [Bacteroidaceae bacterium]